MSAIRVKEWDTIALRCMYQQNDGTPITLSGVEILSSMKPYYGGLPHHMRVEVEDEALGIFTLYSDEEHLSPAKYLVDILFQNTLTLTRISSETFEVMVVPAITSPKE